MTAPDVAKALQDIAATGKAFENNEIGSRERLLALSKSLTAAVELPSEAIQRMGWAEPAGFALCRLAVDLEIFEKLASAQGRPVSVAELARLKKTDDADSHDTNDAGDIEKKAVDEALLSRVMKHLAAMHIVGEAGPGSYIALPLTQAFAEDKYRDGIIYVHDVARPSFANLPAYLKSINYAHPTNLANGPFQAAHNTDVPFFVWLAQNPPYGQVFNSYMGGYRAGKATWLSFYPFLERIVEEYNDQGKTLLVDVGGGNGHDLEAVYRYLDAHPIGKNLVGQDSVRKLVLQDQESVIAGVRSKENPFQPMEHDFFKPQPVIGAKAYYLHSVLHDWDDVKCKEILSHIASALTKGYSKVLINELVVPDVGASWSVTSMDWLMMALGAVKERTETQWWALLHSAGLKVVKIYTYEDGTESLIEAELL